MDWRHLGLLRGLLVVRRASTEFIYGQNMRLLECFMLAVILIIDSDGVHRMMTNGPTHVDLTLSDVVAAHVRDGSKVLVGFLERGYL